MNYKDKWPVYARQWNAMSINPTRMDEFKKLAQFAVDHKAQYKEIQDATGVPWPLIAVLHRRESDADFNTYLGNGEPLNRVTTLVPRGRGPFSSFKAGAIDALKMDGLSTVSDWRLEKMLYYCELFNGAGYNNRGLASPYVWGGTNQQQRGKYVSDGQFNPNAMDGQPGCAPILKMIAELDPSVTYARETVGDVPGPQTTSPRPVMLILRGIAGNFDGKDWPRGALYEQPAKDYAIRRGYEPLVLDVSGETGANSRQVFQALNVIAENSNIVALYGFSGGGYNIRYILDGLPKERRLRFKLIVVLGAPGNPQSAYAGPWELVYRTDPPAGHMAGPASLLAATTQAAAKPIDLAQQVYSAMKSSGHQVAEGPDVFEPIYVEGLDPDGTPNKNRFNAFDDLRTLLQVINGKPKIVFKQDATTEPGKFWTDNRMNPAGAFHIALGQQACWVMGTYHDAPALVQSGPIKGYRDGANHYHREGPLLTEGDIGVHHHGGYNYPHDDLGRSSAGCQVGRTVDGHAEFMRLLKTDRRYRENKNFKFRSTVLTAAQVLQAKPLEPKSEAPPVAPAAKWTAWGAFVAAAGAVAHFLGAHPAIIVLAAIAATIGIAILIHKGKQP